MVELHPVDPALAPPLKEVVLPKLQVAMPEDAEEAWQAILDGRTRLTLLSEGKEWGVMLHHILLGDIFHIWCMSMPGVLKSWDKIEAMIAQAGHKAIEYTSDRRGWIKRSPPGFKEVGRVYRKELNGLEERRSPPTSGLSTDS